MANRRVTPVLDSTAPPIVRLITPFQEFLHRQSTGGVLLSLCTIAAILWANSPWAASYFQLWNSRVTIGGEQLAISKPLMLWINDGLMAIFFFVVGLEIKREITTGELAGVRKAALPVAAALGGMIAPALLYITLNAGQEGSRGWGIPMATDIAFSLAVLQVLGRRVPLSLKVFLTAFAIVDDIGAVLVIALFYTAKISTTALAVAAVLLLLAVSLNLLGVRRPLVYAIVGIILWVAVLKSGVHATVAGVLLAMTIPGRTRIAERHFLEESRGILERFESAGPMDSNGTMNEERLAVVNTMEQLVEGVQSPLKRLEDSLHLWVSLIILPVFALANAGVSLAGTGLSAIAEPVGLGIIIGLVLGKSLGVTLASWLAVRLNIAALPSGVTWMHVTGVAFLGGIGFTMSLFIANLAFGESHLLGVAKLGILAGSVVSAIAGVIILARLPATSESDGDE